MATASDRNKWIARFLSTIPEMDAVSWAPLTEPLSRSRLALVTTGGVHLKRQVPFDIAGGGGYDWSYREIPFDTPSGELMVTHGHYDHAHVDQDINFMLPLDRVRELVAEGVIGELAPHCFSFCGYIKKPEALAATTAMEVAAQLKADAVDAVLLTPA